MCTLATPTTARRRPTAAVVCIRTLFGFTIMTLESLDYSINDLKYYHTTTMHKYHYSNNNNNNNNNNVCNTIQLYSVDKYINI